MDCLGFGIFAITLLNVMTSYLSGNELSSFSFTCHQKPQCVGSPALLADSHNAVAGSIPYDLIP